MFRRSMFILLILALAAVVQAFTNANGLIIKQRFDHNGGTSGYYLGDNAIFGGIIYNQMSKGGYAKFVGDMGSFVIADYASGDIFYTFEKSVKRYKGDLQSPYSIEVTPDGPDGKVYAGDIVNNSLEFLEFSEGGLVFRKSVPIMRPVDVCYYQNLQDGTNEVYVVDGANCRICRYDENLNPVNSHGGLNYFNTVNPPIAVYADYFLIYVLSSLSIDVYAKTGGLVKSIPLGTEMVPSDMVIDAYGNIYVLDRRGYIHKLFNDKYLCSFLSPGTGDYSLNMPTGLSIDQPSGMMTVFDITGLKIFNIAAGIFNFRTDTTAFVRGISSSNNVICFALSGQCDFSLDIRDGSGKVLRTIYYNVFMDPGFYTAVWDAKDYTGSDVPDGDYIIHVKAQSEYGAFNSDEQNIPVHVRSEPKTAISYLSTNVISPIKSYLFIGFTNSESMDETFRLIGADPFVIGKQGGVLAGYFLYDFHNKPLPDGVYRARLTGSNTQGLSCSAETDIVINNSVFQMQVIRFTSSFNPSLSNALLTICLSEIADVTCSVSNGDAFYYQRLNPGTNIISWNGRTADGSILPDGLYSIRINAHQASVESMTTDIGIQVDTTPPMITDSVFNRYLSPIDSPGVQDQCSLSISLNERANIHITVYNSAMAIISNLFDGTVEINQIQSVIWNGSNSGNIAAPDGKYQIQIKAIDDSGNQTVSYEKIVVDNNKMDEIPAYYGNTSFINSLSYDNGGWMYLSRLKKFFWVNGSSLNYYIEDENSLRITENSLMYGPKSYYLSPDGRYSAIWENNMVQISYYDANIEIFDLSSAVKVKEFKIHHTLPYYPGEIYPVLNHTFNINQQYIIVYQYCSPQGSRLMYIDTNGNFIDMGIPSQEQPASGILFATTSPDDRYLIWNEKAPSNSIVVFNLSNKSRNYFQYMDHINWISSNSFLGYDTLDGGITRLFYVNIDTGLISNTYIFTNYGILVDVSPDRSKLLFSDGIRIYIFDGKDMILLSTFNNIVYYINNLEPRQYSIFYSEDSSYINTLAITSQNGLGVYRVDMVRNVPNNLTAEINYPSAGNDTIGGFVKVKGTADDLNFEKYELGYCLWGSQDWKTIKITNISVKQDKLGILDTTILTEGTNIIIRLISYDKAGNTRELQITNTVKNYADYLLSGVSINNKYVSTNGTIINYQLGMQASINIRLKDNKGLASVVYNGQSSSGWHSNEIRPFVAPLSDGNVEYSVMAILNGQTNQYYDHFVLDRLPPTMDISYDDMMLISYSDFLLFGFIDEDNFDHFEIVINSAITNRYFDLPVVVMDMIKLPNEGTNHVDVIAYDKANNITMKSLSFILDTTTPVIRITKPLEGDLLAKNIAIVGTINDDRMAGYDVYLNNMLVYKTNAPLNGTIFIDGSSNQGAVELKINAYDLANNVNTFKRNIFINNIPPVTSVYVGGNPFSNAVFLLNGTNYFNNQTYFEFKSANSVSNSTVTQTFVSLDGADYQALTGSVHFDSGLHNIDYYSVDSVGNIESPKSFNCMIDDQTPLVNLQLSQPYYNAGTNIFIPWNNKIQLQASDNYTGVRSIYYSVDNGSSWNIYLQGGQDGLFLTMPGLNRVMYYAEDNVGNASSNETADYILDPVPPYSQVLVDGQSVRNGDTIYYKNGASVIIVATDDGSGLLATLYQINNQGWVNSTNVSGLNAVSNYLAYYSIDRVSNTENIQYENMIRDDIPPVLSWTISGRSYTNAAIYVSTNSFLYVNAQDELSGLEGILYSINNGDWLTVSNPIPLNMETNQVSLTASDQLTNYSATNVLSYILDAETPASVLDLVSGKQVRTNGIIYCTPDSVYQVLSADRLCGVNQITILLNGETVETNNNTFDFAFGNSDGTNEVVFYAKDNLDNIEATNKITVITRLPDTTLPVSELTLSGNYTWASNIVYMNSNVTMMISATDMLGVLDEFVSGVKQIQYSLNGSGWLVYNNPLRLYNNGIYSFKFRAEDNAGNVEDPHIMTLIVSNNPPVIPAFRSLVIDKTNILYEWTDGGSSYQFTYGNTSVALAQNYFFLSNIVLPNIPLTLSASVKVKSVFGIDSAPKYLTNVLDHTLIVITPPVGLSNKYKTAIPFAADFDTHIRNRKTVSYSPIDPTARLTISTNWLKGYDSGNFNNKDKVKIIIPPKGSLNDGKYILKAEYTDIQSNYRQDARTAIIDNTKPVLDIVVNGIVLNDPTINANEGELLSLSAVDPMKNGVASGIRTIWYGMAYIDSNKHGEIKKNKLKITKYIDFDYGKYIAPVVLKKGYYLIAAKAEDWAINPFVNHPGNWSGNFSITKVVLIEVKGNGGDNTNQTNIINPPVVDYSPPYISVSGATNGGYYNHAVSMNVVVTDVNLAGKSIKLNGQTIQNGSFNADSYGNNVLNVTAWDSVHNTNVKEVNFIIDTINPEITLIGLDSFEMMNGVEFSYSVSDDFIDWIKATLNGTNLMTNAVRLTNIGDYTLVIMTADKAGNTDQATKSFRIVSADKEPPVITITGVTNNKYYNGNIAVMVTVTDDHLDISNTVISMDGSIISLTNGAVVTTASAEGKHEITVYAVDNYGNIAAASRTFWIDKTSPVVFIENLFNNHRYLKALPIIHAWDNISNQIDVEMSLQEKNQMNLFYTNWMITNTGNYILTVNAWDEADNYANKIVKFSVVKKFEETWLLNSEFNNHDYADLSCIAGYNKIFNMTNTPVFTDGSSGKGIQTHNGFAPGVVYNATKYELINPYRATVTFSVKDNYPFCLYPVEWGAGSIDHSVTLFELRNETGSWIRLYSSVKEGLKLNIGGTNVSEVSTNTGGILKCIPVNPWIRLTVAYDLAPVYGKPYLKIFADDVLINNYRLDGVAPFLQMSNGRLYFGFGPNDGFYMGEYLYLDELKIYDDVK